MQKLIDVIGNTIIMALIGLIGLIGMLLIAIQELKR
jgi:hypothetical protein